MGKPYSDDLRDRVVAATGEGMSCRAAAARFGVGVATPIGRRAQLIFMSYDQRLGAN